MFLQFSDNSMEIESILSSLSMYRKTVLFPLLIGAKRQYVKKANSIKVMADNAKRNLFFGNVVIVIRVFSLSPANLYKNIELQVSRKKKLDYIFRKCNLGSSDISSDRLIEVL